jgi:glycosyltransferase involved in cell wall biosynthesis
MRKRIVILAKFFPPEQGGMEVYVHELAFALAGEFDVHVLAHARGRISSEEQWPGFRVVRCGTWFNALSQPFSPRMLLELARLKPDVIQLNAPNAFANLCWRLAGGRARLVVTHHADVIGRDMAKHIYTPLYHAAVAAAAKVIVFSRKNAQNAIDMPACGNKLTEIPQGLDPARFAADEALRAEARAYVSQFSKGKPTLAFVGRLIGYKGLDVLIKAMAQTPGVHAVIAGRGPLQAELAAAAQHAGVSDRFHLLGEVDEHTKHLLLLGSQAFVLPSITTAEAFGIVQVEAQMCGLPIIASNLASGVTDVTSHEVTGLLTAPGDSAALAAAISRLIDNPDDAKKWGAAGYARALQRFSTQAFIAANLELFRDVASG